MQNKLHHDPQTSQTILFTSAESQALQSPENAPQRMLISEIKLNDDNPRNINDDKFKKLVKSIRDFPDMLRLRPLILNRNNVVLGGNMRLKACIELGLSETWVIVAKNLTPEQEREFIIKDNSSFGQWDWELLAADWDVDLLADWGLDVPDDFIPQEEAQEDDFEIPDEIETDIVLGDLLEIGPHRLLCGSATDISVWERLEIQPSTICFTSPPYNVGSSAKLRGLKQLGANKWKHGKDSFYQSHDDNRSDDNYSELLQESLSNAIAFCDGVAFDVQLLSGNKKVLIDWLANNKGTLVDIITWNKENGAPCGLAEGICTAVFEWIVVFNRDNNSKKIPLASWIGTIRNVYTAPPQRKTEFTKVHLATFPMHLPNFIIADLMNTCKGVVDCFMGTGTTMVCAHQLKRKCYGIEIDPKYCQVIINRMMKLDPSIEIKKNGKVLEVNTQIEKENLCDTMKTES